MSLHWKINIFILLLVLKDFSLTSNCIYIFYKLYYWLIITIIIRSTNEEFNPKPATPNHLCHSLIELLSQVSVAFKRNFAVLQKKRTARHPFERVATPYQVYSWTSPLLEHTLDAIRAEDSSYYFLINYHSCINENSKHL